MRRFRTPSPALVISIVALVFSLAGTSYAVSKINGKLIKNRTVSGKALKNNTLTGKQIRESKLGTVPKAKASDSAADSTRLSGLEATAFARNANFVRVFEKMNIGQPDRVLVSHGDISVSMRCQVDGANDRMVIFASTGTNGALLDSEADDQAPLNAGMDPLTTEIGEGLSTTSGNSSQDDGYDDTGFVMSADSARLITLLEGSSTKILNRAGNNCIYSGTFIVQQ